ncbi:MAG: hypothetical protein WAV95_20285 [Azonexus sp.]
MNPEFRRQLWLQFSTARLVLMPFLLFLGSLAVALSSGQGELMAGLADGALTAFVLIVFGMGTNAAGASILEEIQERTWDQQRMSAMQPWAMTWGKLAGATSYAWYGGALCLLVFVPASQLDGWAHAGEMAICAVLGGILLHALLLAINLQLGRNPGKLAQRGGMWALLVLGLWAVGFGISFARSRDIVWWHQEFAPWSFLLGTLLVFAPVALIAAWRLMAENLAVRQLPWGWPALILLLTAYLGGFTAQAELPLSLTGLGIAALLTYASLLSQPQTRVVWQRLLGLAAAGHWRSVLLQLPPWLTSLALVLPLAGLATFELSGSVDAWTGSHFAIQQPLVIALLTVRDCCLLLFFSFNPRARRPQGAFMITMLVLYMLLPWLFSAMDAALLTSLVFPLHGESAIGSGIAALHAGAAILLLRWQWARTRPVEERE